MALAEILKREIRSLSDQGMSTDAVCEKLLVEEKITRDQNKNVANVIFHHRQWREGKKPAVAEGADEKPAAPEIAANYALFPKRPVGEIARIEVRRVISEPQRGSLCGFLADLDPLAETSDIQRSFGGGRYMLTAYNTVGIQIGVRSLWIPGPSNITEKIPEETNALPFGNSPDAGVLSELSAVREQNARLTELVMKSAQTDAQERVTAMGTMYAQQMQFMTTLMNESRERDRIAAQEQLERERRFFERMNALQQSAAPPSGSLKEKLEEMKLLRDLMPSNDGGSDTIVELAKTIAPAVLGIAEAKRVETIANARQMQARAAAQQRMAPPPGAYPPPSVQPPLPGMNLNPDITAPNPGAPQEEDKPLTMDELAQETFETLCAAGIPEEVAAQRAAMFKEFGDQEIQKHASGNGAA